MLVGSSKLQYLHVNWIDIYRARPFSCLFPPRAQTPSLERSEEVAVPLLLLQNECWEGRTAPDVSSDARWATSSTTARTRDQASQQSCARYTRFWYQWPPLFSPRAARTHIHCVRGSPRIESQDRSNCEWGTKYRRAFTVVRPTPRSFLPGTDIPTSRHDRYRVLGGTRENQPLRRLLHAVQRWGRLAQSKLAGNDHP